MSAQKRARAGLTFTANYTWSHSIDEGSTWHSGSTTANGRAGGDAYPTDSTLPQLDRGNSVFDIRHRISITYVWELPFFRTQHGFRHSMFSDWQLSGIASYQTGAHWSPFDGRGADVEETRDGACAPNAEGFVSSPRDCVNLGGDYNLNGRRGDRPNAISDNVDASREQWANGFDLPANFFSTPCLGCVGNLGRNTFIGPDYWSVDSSISKTLSLREHVQLQLRADAYNLLNRTNFQLPLDSSRGHQTTFPFFGQAGGTFNPRQLQFGLRLSF